MTEQTPDHPHLVAVSDPSDDAATDATETDAGPDEGGERGKGLLFWLLVVVALAAVIGLALQTQRAGELADRNEKLAGELFTARSALDAYQARFDEVRASVGGLRAEIEQLNSLVSADPLSVAPAARVPAPAAAGATAREPAGAAANGRSAD